MRYTSTVERAQKRKKKQDSYISHILGGGKDEENQEYQILSEGDSEHSAIQATQCVVQRSDKCPERRQNQAEEIYLM